MPQHFKGCLCGECEDDITFEEQVLYLLAQILKAETVLTKTLILVIDKFDDPHDMDPDGHWDTEGDS